MIVLLEFSYSFPNMNIENDLNIPPDAEPFGRKISRIAVQFAIPVLLPASSAFFGKAVSFNFSFDITDDRPISLQCT